MHAEAANLRLFLKACHSRYQCIGLNSLNPAPSAYLPFPHHTAPDHDGATAKLDCQPDKLAVEASILNPTELLTIQSKEVDLHLIGLSWA